MYTTPETNEDSLFIDYDPFSLLEPNVSSHVEESSQRAKTSPGTDGTNISQNKNKDAQVNFEEGKDAQENFATPTTYDPSALLKPRVSSHEEDPWFYNPHSIPPNNADDHEISLWINYCRDYANTCALQNPYWTPESIEQAHVEAMQKCEEILVKWYENQMQSNDDYDGTTSISFGSFDTNMYFQPEINNTTSPTPSYVYDYKCTTFDIIFGDLESNEDDYKCTSNSQHLHRSHVPID